MFQKTGFTASTLILLGLIISFILILSINGCNDNSEKKRLLNELSNYKLENQYLKERRLKDSSTIVSQQQTFLTQQEAVKLKLLEINDKMKEVESQVKQQTKIIYVNKDIPFIPNGFIDTTGLSLSEKKEIEIKDTIIVPKSFGMSGKWFTIKGFVRKDGIKIQELIIPNKTTTTVGYIKSGFLGLGRDAVVEIKNDNPYIKVESMSNVIVKKKKTLLSSPAFLVGIGIVTGLFINK